MAVVKINLSCELSEAVKVQYLHGNLFSQDHHANEINVAVFEDGEPVELAGTVTANVIRPDGGTVAVTGGTYSGNVATITMPSAVYAIPGAISVAVKITLDSVVTTIAAFAATVYATSTDTAVDPGTIIPSIQTLIAEIEAAVDSIPADYSSLWATLAPNYSNLTFPVAVGQYCTYDGGFYRCNTAIATQEAWTAAHWTATNIGADLAETRLDVANLEDDVSELKSAITSLEKGKADAVDITLDTPASVMTFSDGADGMPMAVKIGIEPVRAGSGDPSPENIRTISGWLGARISRTSRNLLGGVALRDAIKAYLPQSVTDDENKTINFSAATTVSNTIKSIAGFNISSSSGKLVNNLRFEENTQYTFIIKGTGGRNLRIWYTDGTNEYLRVFDENNMSLTVSAAGKTVRMLGKSNSSGNTTVYYEESGIFEGVLTENQFEPWTGNQYDITFSESAETVYGGTLEVYKDGTGKIISTMANIAEYDGETLPGGWISDRDVYAEGTTPTTGAQVVYELAEADYDEYTLSSAEVNALLTSLKGVNNVFADTGDILSVEYSADTKLYVDQQITEKVSASQRLMELIVTANREDTMKATKAYTTGDLLIVNGTLYKASTSIANGATLTEGTNVTATTVAAEIAALA